MKARLKRIISALAFLSLVAVIFVAVRGYPYLKPPAEDVAVLEAWLEKWEAKADELRNLPEDDRLAFDALMEEMKPLWLQVDNLAYNECPPFDPVKLREYEPVFRAALRFDPHIAALAVGGFKYRDDGAARTDPPWGQYYRRWVNLELWLAAAGYDPAPRLMRLLAINAGLRDCPYPFNVVNSIGIERVTDTTIAFLLPGLTQSEIDAFGREISGRSNSAVAAIDAVAVAAAAIAARPNETLRQLARLYPTDAGHWFLWVADLFGWPRRERLQFLSLHRRLERDLRAWYADGGGGGVPDLHAEAKATSVFAATAMPTPRTYVLVGARQMQRREGVMKALRAELKWRVVAGSKPFRLRYDARHEVVVGDRIGCIIFKGGSFLQE